MCCIVLSCIILARYVKSQASFNKKYKYKLQYSINKNISLKGNLLRFIGLKKKLTE